MNFFKHFKSKKPITEIYPIIEELSKDTLHLLNSEMNTFSKIGGQPNVNENFIWPTWKNKSLAFLAQLKFSEINGEGQLPNVPTSGLLHIFYDQEQSTWGFDPKDKGSWSLLFTKDENTPLNSPPYPSDIDDEVKYKEIFLKSNAIKSYPNWEEKEISDLNMSETESDIYEDFRTSQYQNESLHQIGGWPNPIQTPEMHIECQLASNGLYCGDESGYNDPRAKELQKHANDWVLLMQIDSDDDASMMWGDTGILYFWIKKSDLKNEIFDHVWMVLQCG